MTDRNIVLRLSKDEATALARSLGLALFTYTTDQGAKLPLWKLNGDMVTSVDAIQHLTDLIGEAWSDD